MNKMGFWGEQYLNNTKILSILYKYLNKILNDINKIKKNINKNLFKIKIKRKIS